MLLSEIGDKEIIDLSKGSILAIQMRSILVHDEELAGFTLFPYRIFRGAKVATKKICSFHGVRL